MKEFDTIPDGRRREYTETVTTKGRNRYDFVCRPILNSQKQWRVTCKQLPDFALVIADANNFSSKALNAIEREQLNDRRRRAG
jgi:hypothetical protein